MQLERDRKLAIMNVEEAFPGEYYAFAFERWVERETPSVPPAEAKRRLAVFLLAVGSMGGWWQRLVFWWRLFSLVRSERRRLGG